MKRTAKNNVWLVHIPTYKTIEETNKEKEIIKNQSRVYIKSNIRYSIKNKHAFQLMKEHNLSMSTNKTPVTNPAYEEVSANSSAVEPATVEVGGKGLPEWASKEVKPVFITGVKLPDPTDPNAVPWFTPPGFRDESIVRTGVYTRHESESKYIQFGMGKRGYMELTDHVLSTLETFTQQEQDDFGNGNFVRNEALTAEMFDKIEVGHVIGTMYQMDPMSAYALEVLARFPEKDLLACRLWNGEVTERKYQSYKRTITNDPEINTDLMYIAFQDISYGIAMENFNILYYKKELPLKEKDKNIFAPYGYDDKVKEYHMVGRYRIAETYPGFVPDDKLQEEEKLAYDEYLFTNKARLDEIEAKATQEREAKLEENAKKLEEIKKELAAAKAE